MELGLVSREAEELAQFRVSPRSIAQAVTREQVRCPDAKANFTVGAFFQFRAFPLHHLAQVHASEKPCLLVPLLMQDSAQFLL